MTAEQRCFKTYSMDPEEQKKVNIARKMLSEKLEDALYFAFLSEESRYTVGLAAMIRRVVHAGPPITIDGKFILPDDEAVIDTVDYGYNLQYWDCTTLWDGEYTEMVDGPVFSLADSVHQAQAQLGEKILAQWNRKDEIIEWANSHIQ